MPRLARLLLLTFIESFATVLVERGVYFYTHDLMDWTKAANLWLALGIGVSYIAGAMVSHRACVRWSERTVLLWLLLGHIVCHVLLFAWQTPVPFIVVNLALAGLTGVKWPIVESYVSAGRTPAATAKAIGWFNISWSASVPLAVLITGPLLVRCEAKFFLIPVAVNIVSLAILWSLERKPIHLHADHPERLSADRMARFRALLTSCRWSLVGSYTLMFILAPLAPNIFANLGYATAAATALWCVTDACRCVVFLLLDRYPGWHGRSGLLALGILSLPVGFFMVIFGTNTAVVLPGEIIFGLAMGVVYYAALYYAMVVKNASVDAGGAHESLIGAGFGIGPALGLIGLYLAYPLGSPILAMTAATAPVILVFTSAALLPLWQRPKSKQPHRDLQ